QCEPDETRLAGIWDPAVRTELHQPFAAAPAPYAEQTWSTVQTRPDEWANEWLELRTLACQMTQLRDEASEELLAQRYACLDARLREIEAFSVLYREATPIMIERAGSTLFKIPLPRSCIAPA